MIASIYIKEHSYLTDKPLTLNFGGKYLYSFEEMGESLIISRKKNEKYIPNFFNISESGSKIKLLSAIVGKNGVGKSSVLDIIRSIFSKSDGFTHNKAVVLVEIKGKTKILYSTTSFEYFFSKESAKKIEKVNERESYQSIYYSPHFDLKYNPNYYELDKYDISLDEYIKEDLDEIDRKGTNGQGWKYKLHQELKFKNTLRIIEFMDSIPFKKISEHFKLSGYDKVDLIFRDLLSDDNFWNTPSQFRGIITQIKEKLEKERRDWYTIRIFDENHNVKNQDEVNKYLLKNFIIGSILSVICRILEEDAGNFYLEEGYIEKEELFTNRKLNAEQLFLLFLENAYTNIGEKKKKIFDEILYYELFNEIGKVLLPISNSRDVTNQIIHTKLNDIKPIIDLHRKCVRNLVAYFKENEDKNLNLYEFISINAYRNMSSGEFAILNFFSKLYFFLKNKPTTLLNKNNFILLLDEADSGLHPMWKKGFITTILKFIPYFFEGLNSKPNLQIILTTHDPLTLSDIPKHNVIFLEKPEEGKCQISSRVQKTFGANITDLLADSFFLEKGLIGDFALKKINDAIDWINKNKNKTKISKRKLTYYKKVIELIDERVIKLKLSEMITELLPDNTFYNEMIDKEIEKLQNQKK